MKTAMRRLLTTGGFLLAITSGAAHATPEEAYKFCSIAGYAEGLGDFLISSLADKKGQQLISDPAERDICATAFAKHSALGRKNKWLVRKGRLPNPPEVDHQYVEFSSRIEQGILKASGY